MDMNKIKYAVLWLLMLSMALPFSACAGNPPAPARSEETSGSESAPRIPERLSRSRTPVSLS